jgi:hypothetical protein
MNWSSERTNRTFQVHGDGGQGACIAVQSVLQEHGLCGYTEWNSPEWHFFYLTHLEHDAIIRLLGSLTNHFKIHIENGTPQS